MRTSSRGAAGELPSSREPLATRSTPPLVLYLFGSLCVTVRGEPMPRVRTRSVEWLLALLALHHGRAVNRSWLAGTLWPESDGGRALQNLRNDLVTLRKALGPESNRLQAPAHDALTLDLSGATVDVVQFDAAIQSGDEAALRGAVELYVGPLLEDCLEEWALTERTARAEQCLTALETLAERAAGRAEHGAAIRYLRQAAGHDPLRDSLVQRLMTGLAAAGDPAAAIRVYRDFRIRLQEELTAAPEEATTRLFQEIRAAARRPTRRGEGGRDRRGDGANLSRGVAPSPPRPVPPSPRPPLAPSPPPCPLTSLIGREQQVEQLQQTLRQARLMTLVGGGGVGKTRLALEVTLQAGGELPGRAIWVELGALADGALLLPSVAAAVGIRDDGGDAAALIRRLVARLTDEVSLLVLDNCEHLLDAAAAAVRLLLQHCPDLQVLATSRQRLGLPGEIVWRVPSLPVPDEDVGCRVWAGTRTTGDVTDKLGPAPAEPDTLLACPSVRLFVERAAAVHPGFRLTSDAEAVAVGLICRRLDGIPLAIELAAARARVLTPQQIAARLDDRFTLLTRGARGVLPRHQTLRALIDWSYDTLPKGEATLLRRLSVFAGGWTLEAAEAVCSGVQVFRSTGVQVWEDQSDPTDPTDRSRTPERLNAERPNAAEVLDLLDSLVDRSLVLVDEVSGGLRYRILETVREYAWEKLAGSGEQDAIQKRHWQWYLQFAEQERAAAHLPGQREWLLRPQRELDNFRVALRACHEAVERSGDRTAAEAGLRLAAALDWFWVCRGYIGEGLAALETTLADGADLPAAVRAPALGAAGNMAATLGDAARAQLLRSQSRQAYETVLQDVRGSGNRQAIAATVLSLVETSVWMGDQEATWSYGLQARQLMEEVGDPGGLARALEALAGVVLARGEPFTARPLLEERLAICRRLGTPSLLIHALGAMGHLERDEGHDERARAYYQETLMLRWEVGDKFAMAQSLEDLAVLAGKQRQTQRAIRLLGAEAAFCEALGARPPVALPGKYEHTVAEARATLDEAEFPAAWAEGRAMSLEEAVAYALAEE